MEHKERRHCYSIKFKLEVVAYAKQHGNRAAERHFGSPPNEKMVRMWRRQEDKLKAAKGKHYKTCFRSGIVKWPELEIELKTWVADHRSTGISVSTKMIIHHSKEIARIRGLNDFKGTPSWCHRFMRRNGLCMRVRTTIAQKMPEEYEVKIIEFHRFVIKVRKALEGDYELSQMGNMDEVPMNFDVPSNRTVDIFSSKKFFFSKYPCKIGVRPIQRCVLYARKYGKWVGQVYRTPLSSYECTYAQS